MIGWFKKKPTWVSHDGRGNPFSDPTTSIDVIEYCGKIVENTDPWSCGGFWDWTPDNIQPEDIVKYRISPK